MDGVLTKRAVTVVCPRAIYTASITVRYCDVVYERGGVTGAFKALDAAALG